MSDAKPGGPPRKPAGHREWVTQMYEGIPDDDTRWHTRRVAVPGDAGNEEKILAWKAPVVLAALLEEARHGSLDGVPTEQLLDLLHSVALLRRAVDYAGDVVATEVLQRPTGSRTGLRATARALGISADALRRRLAAGRERRADDALRPLPLRLTWTPEGGWTLTDTTLAGGHAALAQWGPALPVPDTLANATRTATDYLGRHVAGWEELTDPDGPPPLHWQAVYDNSQ